MDQYNQVSFYGWILLVCLASSVLSQTVAIRTKDSTACGNLSTNDPTFIPPHDANAYFYYQAFQMRPDASGTYVFISNGSIDIFVYIYNNTMDPSDATRNLLITSNTVDDNHQYKLATTLKHNQDYVLLVTTRLSLTTGSFLIRTKGPAWMRLTSIALNTSHPINLATNIVLNSTGHLTLNHSVFHRPGNPTEYYFYEAWQLTVEKTGLYRLTTESKMDTFGCLYYYASEFLNLDENLILADDDSGFNNQFEIEYALEYNQTYILVVTTSFAQTIGNYILQVSGPAPVSIMLLTPRLTTYSTQPITSTTRVILPVLLTYSGTLTPSSSIFTRYPLKNERYYYQAFRTRVQIAGTYTFISNGSMNTLLYLYYDSFDPLHPDRSLIIYHVPDEDSMYFELSIYLQRGSYNLIITTSSSNTTGIYLLSILGRQNLFFETFLPTTTKRPPTGMITINGSLSSNSLKFRRTAHKNRFYYYQTFQFTTVATGVYTFTSRSSMNTFGSLYHVPIDPSDPNKNLIISDDDSGGNNQFSISITIDHRQNYILLVTTSTPNTTGSFFVEIRGPASISICAFKPTTVKPMRKTDTTKLTNLEIVAIIFACLIFLLMVFSVWFHQRRRRTRNLRRIRQTNSDSDISSGNNYVLEHLRRNQQRVQRNFELDPTPAYTAPIQYVEESPPSYEQFVASLAVDQ